MMQLSIIGNLGADAERKSTNGRDYVTFRVAHSEKQSDGSERTTWVSCIMSGNAGNLFDFLKRGTKVYASGRMGVRVYSSPKTKAWEAGVELSVDRVELCGQRVTLAAVKSALADCSLTPEQLQEALQNNSF